MFACMKHVFFFVVFFGGGICLLSKLMKLIVLVDLSFN